MKFISSFIINSSVSNNSISIFLLASFALEILLVAFYSLIKTLSFSFVILCAIDLVVELILLLFCFNITFSFALESLRILCIISYYLSFRHPLNRLKSSDDSASKRSSRGWRSIKCDIFSFLWLFKLLWLIFGGNGIEGDSFFVYCEFNFSIYSSIFIRSIINSFLSL